MDSWEKLSLDRCLRVFCDRPIVFMHPKGLEVSRYRAAAQLSLGGGKNCRFLPLPPENFRSVASYNDLMLSAGLYRALIQYEYILLYQLDAYVFEDRLSEFLDADIDYIGAPCFEGRTHATEIRFTGHENGGLSLRQTDACLRACRAAKSLKGILALYRGRYLGKKDILCLIARRLGLSGGKRRPYRWEDMFFSFAAPMLDPSFTVASFERSGAFSFDYLPEKMYEKTDRALPMGCHAFFKDGRWEFWKQFIDTPPANTRL